ncbi:hypothetical protein [Niveispirillum sp. BGYR6]|uniref:hypothetical protein n=1 Tax=Niveispirillum sp. BGYR6 TaxID=2971249 RepID=UPI0022B95424|nr:hypothetical protein [Niveispirillum sp. BGYR6]MDG5497569.1 hypothetical protein [Niveispirillum sp. BGYR6]
MPEVQKVSVALTGEQVAALRAAVDAGEAAHLCRWISTGCGRKAQQRLNEAHTANEHAG